MKTGFSLLAFLLLFVSSGYAQQTKSQSARNKETTIKIIKAFDAGDADALENWIAKDAVTHSDTPPGMKSSGLEAVKEMCKMHKAAFPDMKTTIRTIATAGDTVIAYFVSVGTNTGPFMGMPATNKKINMEGVDIIRFKNGKAVEHWGVYDNMKMMQQMGMMPPPPPPPVAPPGNKEN